MTRLKLLFSLLFRTLWSGISFVIFLLLFSLVWYILLGVSDFFTNHQIDNSGYSVLLDAVRRYQETHNGKSPESILEISARLDEIYGRDFIIVNQNRYLSSKNHAVKTWNNYCSYFGVSRDDLSSIKPYSSIIAARRPYRTLLPFPFALHVRFHPNPKEYADSGDAFAPSFYGTFTDIDSRRFCEWASKQTNSTNQKLPNYNYWLSFIPDVIYYLILITIFILLLIRMSRVAREEKSNRNLLEEIFNAFSSCNNDNIESDQSEHNSCFSNLLNRDSYRNNFQYLGNIKLKFNGNVVLFVSKKTWLSPLFPFFGGRRAFLLLENGQIIKLKGFVSVSFFYRVLENAKQYYRDIQTQKSRFFSSSIEDERRRLLQVGEHCPSNASKSFEINSDRVLTKALTFFLSPLCVGISVFATSFVVFLIYELITFGCASEDSYFHLAVTLVFFGVPYWVVFSNLYAEY